jgi:hypothetical protein
MAITKDTAPSAHPSTREAPKEERSARLRMHHILREAQERYHHELLDDEERLILHDRIIKLKTKLAATSS